MPAHFDYAAVFNGGVSLAVWMGGVTHEVNDIRLASDGFTKDDAEGAVLAAWVQILQQTTISIDLVAGTSAGGLNGSLLATAVARGADLPPMSEVWTNVASLDVGKLTRSYKAPRKCEPENPTSVLDGTYFRQEIEKVFERVRPSGDQSLRPKDCRLLVTATALNSDPTRRVLENGETMDTVDSRRVYRFKRETITTPMSDGIEEPQPEDTNDFDRHRSALGLAARASASFPAAFEPVAEDQELVCQRVDAYSGLEKSWLADGGLLDNAPFEPLLSALPGRPLSSPSTRVLLYVTPAIDGAPTTTQINAQVPPSLKTSLKWVISAMRQPDSRLDRDALSRAFSMMSFAHSKPQAILADYLRAPRSFMREDYASLHAAAQAMLGRYLVNRARALEAWAMARSGPDMPTLSPPRSQEIRTVAETLDSMPSTLLELIPRYNKENFTPVEQWTWGLSTAERLLQWWGLVLNDLPGSAENTAVACAMAEAAEVRQWVSAERGVLYNRVHAHTDPEMTLAARLEVMHDFYFTGDSPMVTTICEKVMAVLKLVAASVSNASITDILRISLSITVVSDAFSWDSPDAEIPVFHYLRITPGEDPPSDLIPDVTLPNTLDGQPVSWKSRKLYGERLDHFGAFTSPEGRRLDWIWGRIDGAWQLSEHLLTFGGVEAGKAELLRNNLIDAILTAEGIDSRRNFRERAKGACQTTDLKMIEALIDGSKGLNTLRNLMVTLLLLRQPKERLLNRLGWVIMAPIYPRRHLGGWLWWHQALAAVSWGLTLPLRSCAIRFIRWHVIKSATKTEGQVNAAAA